MSQASDGDHRVATLRVCVPPTGGCFDDMFAADAAHRLTASDTSAAGTQVPHHSTVVVEFVGVRENPRAAACARLAAVDVMHSRPDHCRPCAPL